MNTYEKIIAISVRVLKMKTDNVIFVSMAARFVTSVTPIATIASMKRNILVLANNTAITVNGVMMQP